MSVPLRLLIVEDSPQDALLLVRMLRRGGYEPDFERVDSREGLSAALGRQTWDLVFSDHSMPGFDSFAALSLVKERGLDLPFIIVSGTLGEENAVAAMRAGAHDYLTKDHLRRLIPAVERELREGKLRRERTRVEQALRRSERLKAAVLDAAFDCVISVDAEGGILEWNPAAEQAFGYRRDEVLGRPAAEVIGLPSSPDGPFDSFTRLLSAGGEEVLGRGTELLARRRDGTPFPVEIAVRGIELAGGAIGTAYIRDVTQPRQAAEALIERARIAALSAAIGLALTRGEGLRDTLQTCAAAFVQHLETALARIWTLDTRGDVLELQASAGMYTGLGGSHSRIPVGQREIGLIAAERRPQVSNDLLRDPRLSDPDWARREGLTAFAGHPLLVDGELVGVLAMFARTPLSEAALFGLGSVADAIAVGIKRKLVEQTQAAMEAQLRQAQKMEAVGRLAGGIAHDFNNLLTVISGYGALALEHLDAPEPLRRDLAEIQAAAGRAAGLTRQLLAFGRRQVLQPQILDLNAVVRTLDGMLRRLIGEDIALDTRLQPGLGRVKADPGQLEQVIMNLVINARDAMPGGGRLLIETEDVDLDLALARGDSIERRGPHVRLGVHDSGSGMDPETLGRIFEPFFTTKEKGKGTGLGLSMVHGIVQQSGGDVCVRSEPGRGTSFLIYLPRVAEEPRARNPVGPAGKLRRGTETILLVEDNEAVRAITAEILRLHGYTVLEAGDGSEALRVVQTRAGTIHLVLTDLVMPVMGGRELAEQLARIGSPVKVLFFSGYAEEAVAGQGKLASGADLLHKPYAVEELGRKVRDLLDRPSPS